MARLTSRDERADFVFVLNASALPVSGIAPQLTLLDFVRSQGLTGAKEGCAEGECGACAVLVREQGLDGSVYRAVNSCLVPLPAVADREVFTVEALAASGRLTEVQSAMMAEGGSQCGYCTPGFIVSMFAEQYRRDGGERDVHSLGGNLCRCTGYRPIRDAFLKLGPAPEGEFRARLEQPAPEIRPLRYRTPQGRFSRPATLEECLEIIGDPDAQLVAGNTDLGVLTNLRDRRFAHLVSVEGLPALREFWDAADSVEIGAALTLTEIEERWRNAPEMFREWLRLFASPLIRNRATLGGNLATASPIGDAAPMLLALDAAVVIASKPGERVVALRDFFRGYRQTVLAHGEILKTIRIPKPIASHARFYKVAKRSLDDISTVAAGLAMQRDAAGRVLKARFAFGGVAPVPVRSVEAEQTVEGTLWSETDLEAAKTELRRTLKPISDHRGSARYRLALVQNLLEKFRVESR
jgi:xanthine dehydrogenase small subunit